MGDLGELRQHALSRSLFAPTTLPKAIAQLGFVQADPIRSPARAQDLILRHRVTGYCAGDLERRYEQLDVEEDFFINYGFLPRGLADAMHPRISRTAWSAVEKKRAQDVLAFVQECGVAHPSEVDAHFQHGRAQNWFGGNSRVSTQLLDAMHYRGLLRTARRESGIRTYAVRTPKPPSATADAQLDALLDVAVALYAPLPAKSLAYVCSLLMRGVPQWQGERARVLARAKARLLHAVVDGVVWYWPECKAQRTPGAARQEHLDRARFLAPFDPLVWDRTRFEILWGWAYRFEAYMPAAKRQMGYYAMPLIWRGDVIGWGNVDATGSAVEVEVGLAKRVAKPALKAALAEEMLELARFLGKPVQTLRVV